MKTKLYLICFFLFPVFSSAQNSYVDGRLFVKIKDSCSDIFPLFDTSMVIDTNELIIQGVNLNPAGIIRIEKTFNQMGGGNSALERVYTFHFNPNYDPEDLIALLADLGCVEYAEKVGVQYLSAIPPNDLKPASGSPNQWGLHTILASDAWMVMQNQSISFGSNLVKVAIIDDAIAVAHPDLQFTFYINAKELNGSLGIDDDGNGYVDDIRGWDGADLDGDVNPPSVLPNPLPYTGFDFNHGTHVAGIAGAQTDNGIGIASIGWGIQVIPIKVAFDQTGVIDDITLKNGVEYAMKSGAHVINISLGSYSYSTTMELLFASVKARGITVVAAAGNDNLSSPLYPASYSSVISVGATNGADQKASFSNYGSTIDVMAPGEGIYSTLNPATYGYRDGTSMASPLVAGLCGLMLQLNPSLSPDAIENCLKAACANINAQNPGFSGQLGSGRIDAKQAMLCVLSAPVAEFSSNFQTICPDGTVRYSCNFSSSSGSTTYSWSFPGGNPSSSTSPNPVVVYSTPGDYDVSVTISNSLGSLALSKTNYIHVKSQNGNYLYSNKVDNNWYTYSNLALTFNGTSGSDPDLKVKGSLYDNAWHGEGCASISSYDGHLLFYTNGKQVYNRYHKSMLNGQDLVPFNPMNDILTISQNSIIVPDPDECSHKYFLFHQTIDALYYSIIDMDQDNGLGRVMSTTRLFGTPTEMLTAIMHCNGRDVWVIAQQMNSKKFHSYLVSPGNVSSSAVVSDVGIFNIFYGKHRGSMKGSPNGEKLAVAISYDGVYPGYMHSQLLDFDKKTGQLSNPIQFNVQSPTYIQGMENAYGVEFSPDGSKVYLASGRGIIQYELSSFSSSTQRSPIDGKGFCNLNLGPDGKIYCGFRIGGSNYQDLSVISSPNASGSSCNFEENKISIQNGPNNHISIGLTNTFISKTLNYQAALAGIKLDIILCQGSTQTLDAGPGAYYLWDNSSLTGRKVVVSSGGEYGVIITDDAGCKTRIIFNVIEDQSTLNSLGPDFEHICGDNPNLPEWFDAGSGFSNYKWSTGSISQTAYITQPGTYWVEVTTEYGCILRDELTITPFQGTVYRDSMLYRCGSGSIDLNTEFPLPCNVPSDGLVYPWRNRATNAAASSVVTPTESVTYYQEVYDYYGCLVCAHYVDINYTDVAYEETETVTDICMDNTITLAPSTGSPCDQATNHTWIYPDGSEVSNFGSSPVTMPVQEAVYHNDVYRIRSLLPNGCYCEKTIIVDAPDPEVHVMEIEVPCGETLDLDDYYIASCSETGHIWNIDPYPFTNGQINPHIVNPTSSMTYYRFSFDGATFCENCVLELRVKVINADQVFTIPNTECFGQFYDFVSQCPGGQDVTGYKFITPSGVEYTPSSGVVEHRILDNLGDYKLITYYSNGCQCTTVFKTTAMSHPPYYNQPTVRLWFCDQNMVANPVNERCPEATSYVWYWHLTDRFVNSQDGSLDYAGAQYLMNGVTGYFPGVQRIALGPDGCELCREYYPLENEEPFGYVDPVLARVWIGLCENECFTLDMNKYFPGIPACQDWEITFQTDPAALGMASSPSVSYLNGKITICNTPAAYPGFFFYFRCKEQGNETYNGCDYRAMFQYSTIPCSQRPTDINQLIETNSYSGLQIFPNPNNGHFNLKINTTIKELHNTIIIRDMLGRECSKGAFNGDKTEIDISYLSEGVYLVIVENEAGRFIERVQVKND